MRLNSIISWKGLLTQIPDSWSKSLFAFATSFFSVKYSSLSQVPFIPLFLTFGLAFSTWLGSNQLCWPLSTAILAEVPCFFLLLAYLSNLLSINIFLKNFTYTPCSLLLFLTKILQLSDLYINQGWTLQTEIFPCFLQYLSLMLIFFFFPTVPVGGPGPHSRKSATLSCLLLLGVIF